MTPNIEIEEKNPEASEMTSKFAYIGRPVMFTYGQLE